MTVSDIYTAVRCCIDEEPVNSSYLDGASAFDFDSQTTDIGLMNKIIKNKIPAALRWVTLYAPSDALSGSSSDSESESSDTTIDIIHEEDLAASFGVMSIPMLVVLKNGEVANKSVGVQPKEKILEMVK